MPLDKALADRFILLIGSYAALHFVLRLIFSPVLGTDDVEQAICAQELALGCDLRQPPLYTWLQWLTNQVAGAGIFSIFLLKYLLLFATYLFLYLAGRRLLLTPVSAALAALSLWLMYPFAVSVHQGVTHSLLMSLLIAASFFLVLRLPERRLGRDYLLLGVLVGLGMLSKYSFAIYAGGLALAALTRPVYRRALLDPRILLTLAAAIAVSAPHFLWLWQHLDAAANALGNISQASAPEPHVTKAFMGLIHLGSAILQFLFPLWLVLLAFHPRAFLPLKQGTLNENQRFTGRVIAFSTLLLVAAILMGSLVDIKPRWMHAIVLLGPLYLYSRIEALGQPPRKGYLAILLGMPLLVIAAWTAQTYLSPKLGKPTRFHAPYDLLSEKLAAAGFTQGTIVADGLHLAGNLRVAFPSARIVTPAYAHFLPSRRTETGSCLLAWESRQGNGMPPSLDQFVRKHWRSIPPASPSYVTAPYHGSPHHVMEIGYLLLPAEACHR